MRFRDIIFTGSGAIPLLLVGPPVLARPSQNDARQEARPSYRPLVIVQHGADFIIAAATDRRSASTNSFRIGAAVNFDRNLIGRASPLAMGNHDASDQ